MTAEVVKTIHLSYTAPNLPDPHIHRPNLLSAITQLFDSSFATVCVEGRSGYGKTILLREFAEHCQSPCFSLFLREGSRHSYDPVLARADLTNQLYWHLESQRLPDEHEPSDAEFQALMRRCTRNLSRRNSTAYFVIDGLHNIPDEDAALLQAIFSFLPFGTRPFRFLFSSDTSQDIFRYHKSLRVKPFVLMTFNSHETDEYLSEVIETKSLRLEHHKALGGVPSLLASARRQILTRPNPDEFQSLSLPPDIDAFLEAEWKLLTPLSTSSEAVISYLIAYGRPISTAQLARHTELATAEVEQLLRDLPFLSFSDRLGGWEFTSEPFQKYIEGKLKKPIFEAREQIATRLLHDPDSVESLHLLPQYLERIADANKILEWFDEHRFAKILLNSRSPAWTEPILRNAIVLSHESRNDRALTTYSVLRSIVPQITNITGIEDEIRARCALGDFDGAQSIVYSARLLTQKLRLMAVLVDAGSSQPGVVIQPLREEIADLVGQLDLDSIPKDEAIDIAIDLYPVDQELALRIIKAAVKEEDGEDSFDIALARITVAALRSQHAAGNAVTLDDTSPKSSDVLVDERVQKFFNATQRSLKAKTANEVLEFTTEIDTTSERLFILRKWIDQHRMTADVLTLVEKAVNDAISAPDFTPTATFYREVLAPLTYATASPARSRIIAIVEAQRPVIKAKGPTIDDVRIQLTIASCNCQEADWQRAADRLEELYLSTIDPIEDIETLTTCLAWCIAHLHRYDPDEELDNYSEIRDLVESEFAKATSEVFDNSAEQYVIFQKTIDPLAQFVPKRALELCRKLNTVSRRSQAVLEFVSIHSDERQEPVDFPLLMEALSLLEIGPTLDEALTYVCRAVVKNIETTKHANSSTQAWLLAMKRCAGSDDTSECLARVAATLAKVGGDDQLQTAIAKQLRTEFSNIQNPGDRYSVGCKLIFLLNEHCPELARDVFSMFSDDGKVPRLAENVEQGSFYIVDLLAKSSCALARAGLLSQNDVSRICSLISEVRDVFLRIRLYARLAFFYWREGQKEHFSSIVNGRIWPELLALEDGDKVLLYTAWVAVYGVVWLEDRDRARLAISHYPQSVRHPGVVNLCFALLYKLPLGEPMDRKGKPAPGPLSYTDVRSALRLCEELEEDFAIFSVLEGIADLLHNTNVSGKLTRDQRAEISRLMLSIAENCLPHANGVQHHGYQVVCKAQGLRVIRASNQQWLELIAEGQRIENLSDRVFVSALLASYLPNRMRAKREELFKLAEDDTGAIRSVEDRYQRLETLAERSMDTDRGMATRMTEMAFRTVTVSDDGRNALKERRLVDLAYTVDPELPMRMALLHDDDPAREKYRDRARKQIDNQELRRALADVRQDLDLKERHNDPNLAVAAWQSLAGLNAGRALAVDMNRIRDMLMCASNYPLETAYPMYSWVLSNVMEKYARTDQAPQYIRDLFEGLARGAGFFFLITGPESNLEFNPKWSQRDEEDVHIVLSPGDREKALQFLRSWVDSNAEEFVTIVDPYFGPEDLWVIRLVMEWNPRVDIRVLTGRASGATESSGGVADLYRVAWRNICDQDPPHTEILSVSLVDSRKCPIHDRWILSKSAGLRLGTSINSIGNKLSEISAMDSHELERVQHGVDGYLARSIREGGGERVTYELFELLP